MPRSALPTSQFHSSRGPARRQRKTTSAGRREERPPRIKCSAFPPLPAGRLNLAVAHVNAGNIAFESGDLNRAQSLLKESLREDSENGDDLYFFALATCGLAQFEAAEEALRKLTLTAPEPRGSQAKTLLDLVVALRNGTEIAELAWLYLPDPDRLDEAQRLAMNALKMLPDDRGLTATLAEINYRRGGYRGVQDLLQKI